MKNVMVFLAVCLSLALLAGCASATPVPTPLITATPIPPTLAPTATPEKIIPTEVQPTATVTWPEGKPEWTFAAEGPILSPITVAEGVIYFGSEDKYLYAVDSATHDLKWKYKVGGSVRSQPAVAKDKVYAASDDGYLYAVAKSDGSMLWKSQIAKTALTRSYDLFIFQNEYTSSPILQDMTLYIGSIDGNLLALEAETGKTLWKYTPPTGAMPIYTDPLVADGMVYFGDIFGNFYAIDAKEGTKVWFHSTADSNQARGMTLIDHVLYVITLHSFHALDGKTGQVKWEKETSGTNLVPAYENGILYADGWDNGTWYLAGAYEATTGKMLWVTPDYPSNHIVMTSPIVGQSTVYIGVDREALYAVDKKTGVIKWKLVVPGKQGIWELGSGVNSTAAVADGMVYFGGMDGKLYAVKDQ